MLGTGIDLLLVVLGFGSIIFFHELGHFLAARWARIRVLAFAIGFGPALFSYRKGLGLRRGSSVAEVEKIAQQRGLARPGRPSLVPGISPTEYRLNVLPFGGYVKMLGQEDAEPTARSDEPDGYQATPPWKRMIVISAGVVANFLVAAILFVAIFMLGLRTEPPVIGDVDPMAPAATAVALNAKKLGVTEPGLQPGDRILSINGDKPDDFSEIIVATAMARKGRSLRFEVERDGVSDPLLFDITPREDMASQLLQIGVGPAVASTIFAGAKTDIEKENFSKAMALAGLSTVKPGMKLVQVGDDTKVKSAYDIDVAARRSGGKPFDVVFRAPGEGESATEVVVPVVPRRELDQQTFRTSKDSVYPARHLLGLMPVMMVLDVLKDSAAANAGLRAGDAFVQIGSVEWPSVAEGISEIRSNRRGTVRVVVLREVDGEKREVNLGDVPVSREGTLGFNIADSTVTDTRVTAWPSELLYVPEGRPTPGEPAANELSLMRGSRILRVNDSPVTSMESLATALIAATASAKAADAGATVQLAVELPVKENGRPAAETVDWALSREAIQQLHSLRWSSPIETFVFNREEITLQASDPIQAVAMGLSRTKRVMMQTYLTFSRLFQGSVKFEHLKGPVGIAHMGTIIASKGFVHLLFFMALISVNLGVVNFLPIPIADGGHFLFLLYEQITGKPVSVAVQNIAALAGLILIAGMFLLVTYNDITNLFG